MNQKATTWGWKVIGMGAYSTGMVSACDPRDAVSRALTCDLPVGQMVGQHFQVPVPVIDAVPANGDLFYEVQLGNIYLAVREESHESPELRTMSELKALWTLLGDVPVASDSDEEVEDAPDTAKFPDDTIEIPYLDFPAGTPREDIWHWFEAQNKRFVVGEALMKVWPE